MGQKENQFGEKAWKLKQSIIKKCGEDTELRIKAKTRKNEKCYGSEERGLSSG